MFKELLNIVESSKEKRKAVVNYWPSGSTKKIEIDLPIDNTIDKDIVLAKKAIPSGSTFASIAAETSNGKRKAIVNYWPSGSTEEIEIDVPPDNTIDQSITLAKKSIPSGSTFASIGYL